MAPSVCANGRGKLDADANTVEFERNGGSRLPFFDIDDDGGFFRIIETGRDGNADDSLLLHER